MFRPPTLLVAAVVFGVAASWSFAEEAPPGQFPPPVQFVKDKPGWRRPGKPVRTVDPVPGLADGDAEKLRTGVSDAMARELYPQYVDRLEQTYAELATVPDDLYLWFWEHEEIRTTFWQALDPYYDDFTAAAAVLDTFRREVPEKALAYPHLAVAFAVVWDNPNALLGSRYSCIHGVTKNQFKPLDGCLAAFRYLTDEKRAKAFAFDLEELSWPILVYLANFDVPLEEAKWALAEFHKQQGDVGALYARVKYDYGKLGGRGSALGSNTYSLQNLLAYGGVCGDQAHFCSRTAKSMGIPAMKASGLSRYGGQGHAFACFLVMKKGRPVLDFTGRYFHDFYYTGNIFDPQTRVFTLDRTVAMILDGASLSYEKFALARALARMAAKIETDDPKVSLELAKRALQTNYYCAEAWTLLMNHVKRGTLGPQGGLEWANLMMKHLAEHPDLTWQAFSTFLECIDKKDTRKRQSFYNQAAKLYEERPDLQIELRHKQGLELEASGDDKKAIAVYLPVCAEHAKEGRILLPVVERACALAIELKRERQAAPFLDKLATRFPKKRGNTLAKSFQEMAGMVIPVFEKAGLIKDADRLRRESGR